jgi:hypothetical protein
MKIKMNKKKEKEEGSTRIGNSCAKIRLARISTEVTPWRVYKQ